MGKELEELKRFANPAFGKQRYLQTANQ